MYGNNKPKAGAELISDLLENLDLEKVVNSCVKNHYTVLLISDHGNCDMMINEDGTPNTAHTKNLVPLILINSGYNCHLIIYQHPCII